jgi:hypothetical protein
VQDVVVHARLVDAGGATLATVDASALVPVVRAGEPVPFEATSAVPSTQVASVQWSVTASAAEATPSRDLELATFWTRGVSDPRPVDLYLFADPPSEPHPLVVFGSATAVGAEPVTDVAVLGAWMDASGRIVAVERALVVRPGGELPEGVLGPAPAPTLAVGDVADVLLVLDAPTAPPGIDDAQLLLWGSGA